MVDVADVEGQQGEAPKRQDKKDRRVSADAKQKEVPAGKVGRQGSSEKLRWPERVRIAPWLSVTILVVLGVGLVVVGVLLDEKGCDPAGTILTELGAIVAGISVVGFMLEFLGWKHRITETIKPMLLDVDYVTRAGYDPEQIKRAIHTLISAMYPGGKIAPELFDAFDGDVFNMIAKPVRLENHVVIRLKADPGIDAVHVAFTTHYTSTNYSHEAQPLFDSEIWTRQWLRCIPGIGRDTLFHSGWLRVDGERVELAAADWYRLPDYDLNHDMHGQRVKTEEYPVGEYVIIEAKTKQGGKTRILEQGASAEVTYSFSVTMLPWDYYVLTMPRIARGLTVTVDYDREDFEFVEIESAVPPYWGEERFFREIEDGRVIARVSEYMLPGHSAVVVWRRKPLAPRPAPQGVTAEAGRAEPPAEQMKPAKSGGLATAPSAGPTPPLLEGPASRGDK